MLPCIIDFYTRPAMPKFFFYFLADKRYLRHDDWQSCWFFKMNGLLHTEKYLRFHVGKIALYREGTYDFTNDLTGMHLPALLPNNTWKTFRYARWCSLVLLDEKRKHSGRISLAIFLSFILALLSSLLWVFRASGFSSVHRETEHVFCFSPPVCFRDT